MSAVRISRVGAAAVVLAASSSWGELAFAAGGESGAGLGTQLIQPQLGTIFWTFVTFLLMSWILGRFAWKPLLGALEAREVSIRESLDQARRDRESAEALLAEQRALVDEVRRERAEVMAQGRRDAERVKGELLEEARRQRDQLLRQTDAQVDAALRQARTELRGVVTDLAIQAAERLLGRNLDDAAQRRLVEEHLAELERTELGKSPSATA